MELNSFQRTSKFVLLLGLQNELFLIPATTPQLL